MSDKKKPDDYLDNITAFSDLNEELPLEDVLELKKTVPAKSLADKAGLSTTLFRKHYEIAGPQKTGIINFMGSWLVNLPVFKKYYKEHLAENFHYEVSELPEGINDLRDLFKLKGVYRLKAVTDLQILPFPDHKIVTLIREESKKDGVKPSDTRKKYGVWKGIKESCYLIHMPTFVKWFESLWKDVALK